MRVWETSECLLLQCSSEEDKQLAASCKPKVGGVQRAGEHVFQLSHLQEGLSPTRRREEGAGSREEGGEEAGLSRE